MQDTGELGANSVFALKELIMGDEEEDELENYQKSNMGSMLNPGNIGPGGKKEEKETAKAFAKIDIKPGQKPSQEQLEAQAKLEALEKQQKKQKKQTDKNAIWQEDEVKDLPIQKNDTRETPEFDSMFKQRVGTEDIYLGTTAMNPTSTKCQDLLIKIYLPGSNIKDIQLDITKEALVVQSTRYYLHHVFPYPVNDKEGNAKWISDKHTLQLTLPIIREFDFGGLL